MKKTINTTWEVWTYDVWGNEEDGYEVNDRYCESREYPMKCRLEVNNPGSDREFVSAYPSDYAIKQALSIKKHLKIDVTGDDITIYVEVNGYPIGELICTSHKSLSPITI